MRHLYPWIPALFVTVIAVVGYVLTLWFESHPHWWVGPKRWWCGMRHGHYSRLMMDTVGLPCLFGSDGTFWEGKRLLRGLGYPIRCKRCGALYQYTPSLRWFAWKEQAYG